VDIKVFAIEMVYVPTGAYAAGSGGSEASAFTLTTISTGTATTVPSGSGALGGAAGGYPTNQTVPANASWPNGYNAFYCMKYEISQQQYVDFLNTLTQTQATARKYTMTGNDYRYAISGSVVGSYTTASPYLACNYVSWANLASYLDWSGLRPMTELEYEKACRGTLAPVPNEYAWGSTSITQITAVVNSEAYNEVSNTAGANCSYGNATYIQGPMRVGAFSTSSSTSRLLSGATYYGIMEMSGGVYERTVTVGHSTGRAFTGTHGNGGLNSNGDADASSWPATDAVGAGFRGGNWYEGSIMLRVSDRNYAATVMNFPDFNYGGRGVRTVPLDNPASLPAEMISVTGGTFTAGSTVTTISSFSIDKYEVTYEKYTAVRQWGLVNGYTDMNAGTNGYNPAGSNNPVTTVSWYDVVKWCNARSEKEGLTPVYYTTSAKTTVYRTGEGSTYNLLPNCVEWTANGYRLSTEAEWEFAAKGGVSSKGYDYSGSNTVGDVAWWVNNSGTTTHTVGGKAANELGIYDMSGNAYEWCWDWYGSSYPSVGATDPQGPNSVLTYRVLRGGAFYYTDADCRSVYRNSYYGPINRNYTVGFRCAQD
jgi:formylglycine-generating enzyme required for sulfatase activity